MWRRIWQHLLLFVRPREWFRMRGRLFQISTEATIALTFVAILMVVVLVQLFVAGDSVSHGYYWPAVLAAPILIPIIGVVTYFTLRWIFQEPYEVFDDIRRDWQTGLAELRRKGLDLRRIPLFLVLGGESNDQVQRLFKASGIDFAVSQHPSGRSSLYWYVNQEVAFITCNEIGVLSDLGRSAAERLLEARVIVSPQGPDPHVDLAATCWPTEDSAEEPPPQEAAAVESKALPLDGTMHVNAEMAEQIGRRVERDLQLDTVRMDRELARLEYLCRLIVRERVPYAPINGMMTLLPVNLILGDSSQGSTIKDAVRNDVTAAVTQFGLRFPILPLVNGWEDDPGFQELIRRLPPQNLVENRFGKGAHVGHEPTPDYLEAICHHVCKAFEDWIYYLFKQKDALKRTNNRLLYDLLCKVRRYLNSRLMRILTEGYDCGGRNEHHDIVGMFTGCYVVAAGRDAARQAFVPKVFSRLREKSRDLQWTPAALCADRRKRTAAYVVYAAAVCVMVAAIVLWFFPPDSWTRMGS